MAEDQTLHEFAGLGLLLLAAFFGSAYSAVAKISANRLLFYGALNLVTIGIGAVGAVLFGIPAQESWPYLLISTVTYNIMVFFLIRAYERLDLGQLYALRVCVQLIVVTTLTLFIAKETLNGLMALSLLLLLAGFAVQLPIRRLFEKSYSYGIAVCAVAGILSGIQLYSDFQGIKVSGDPLAYIAFTCFIGLPITLVALYKNREGLLSLLHRERWHILAGSFLDVASYSLLIYVVYGMKVLHVLPASNTGVIFSALIAYFILKENQPRRRILSAVIICCAAILMQISR